MARLVGNTGKVVGLDSSHVMVVESRRRSEGLPAEIVVGDAENLESPADSFDGCRSERAFMYLDAGRALEEMIRVTKPGGRLGVFDLDHDGISIDSPRPATTRKMVQFLSDTNTTSGNGRSFYA